ncbi:MAG TPA: 8-amino-7-oxononanoate synthase [Steroidobacteraceae bacterium]|nr:8-amino-7-oxononanoate synthase [Steroidobacteraceae bacterium]
MPRADTGLVADLAAYAAAGRARRRRTVEARSPGGVRVRVDGRDCLAFCSNDYLGLADHPRIVRAFREAAATWGVGSGASHLVSGHDVEHHALEQELAEFVGRPRAVLFSTGYMANLAVAALLVGRGDTVLGDRLNHASLLDAGLASGARVARFRHADVASLVARLARVPADRSCLVMTDGVFSMDGDVAPLVELAAACRAAAADLMVDDAHGFGVLGPDGAGSVAEAGLGIEEVPIVMGTLGKAVGTFGAFVAGSDALADSLVQRARTYVYTTALPPAVAAATRASLRVMHDEPWRRDRVLAHARRFRESAAQCGLRLLPSRTPIQPWVLGDESTALAAAEALFARGIWVPAIRPPTVPAGSARLRFTFSASHSDEDLDRLLDALAPLGGRGTIGGAGAT